MIRSVKIVAAQQAIHAVFGSAVDDLGWGDVGFHRATPTPEVQTPTIDSLVHEGIELQRHYVYKMCTPTRTSVYSGRLPVHVNQRLQNPDDPTCGIPQNMTGIASKMKQAGYATHHIGKWDAGMVTPRSTPQGRGFDTSLGYFSHKNNYWTMKDMQSGCLQYNLTDLWATDRPAYGQNGTGVYEEFLFRDTLLDIVEQHNTSQPLFLFYAPHVAHCPLQVPKEWFDMFSFMGNDENNCQAQTPFVYPGNTTVSHCRQIYASMVHLLDSVIGNVTTALRQRGMWDNLLVVFSADNGGPVDMQESAASNYPLRGGKYSTYEGGIRSTAFVSGGFVPPQMRNTSNSGLMAIADWYATFCALAGVDPYDPVAAQAHLPPVDGLNMWPMLSGLNRTSPRSELPVDDNTLIQGNMKLKLGKDSPAGWQGPVYPNASSPQNDPNYHVDCGKGCLYNVEEDPTEHNDLAKTMPSMVESMTARLQQLREKFYNNNDSLSLSCPQNISMECACWMAIYKYGGYFGPYAEVEAPPVPPSPPAPPTPQLGYCHKSGNPAAGDAVGLYVNLSGAAVRQLWQMQSNDSTVRLASNTTLCLTQRGLTATGNKDVMVASCQTPPQPAQQWKFSGNAGQLHCGADDSCLDVQRKNQTNASEGNIETYKCHKGDDKGNQQFAFDSSSGSFGRLVEAGSGLVVGVC